MLELKIECMESSYFIREDGSRTFTLSLFVNKLYFFVKTLCDKSLSILGDPGAVSGDGEKSKTGDKKFRRRKVKNA